MVRGGERRSQVVTGTREGERDEGMNERIE
jgi:hypothetical protein